METTVATFRPMARAEAVRRTAKPEACLIGPRADMFLIGGGSIIACLLYWMFVDQSASVETVGLIAYYLSFVVNYPHFLSSYQLLYGDYRKWILRRKSFFWAGVIAPMTIIAALGYGLLSGNYAILSLMAQAMFLSVGWHYVKQIYGVSLLASAVQKRYFSGWEKNVILLNLYSVWAMSWLLANDSLKQMDLDGIAYFTLGLPPVCSTVAEIATAVTLIAAVAMLVRKYIRTGVRPANSSLVGFASIYFWYLPILNHPVFFFMIPFFHSLQYMLFVVALKKNHAETDFNSMVEGPESRRVFMMRYWGFLAGSVVLGAIAFEILPRGLDAALPIGGFNNPSMWLFSISLFINLHHYFIDNVIWRADNEYVREHLVTASQGRVHD